MITGAPAIGAFIAFWGFWALLLLGWFVDELDGRRMAVFIALWVAGRVAAGFFLLGGLLFTPYVAVPDIALVFAIFKRDVRLG